jgi:ubiquinone/menaquinone biosynthesis C-methylase UbiE
MSQNSIFAILYGMFTDKKKVLEQYKDSSNLAARIALHEKFSSSKIDFRVWLFDKLQAPATANVLELGTGSAKLWQSNGERIPKGWAITLTDFSEGMLTDARRNVAEIPANFSFRQVDAQAIPFADKTFDLVMANHMLYHVPDVAKALGEVRRVIKPDGRFYAATGGLTHMKELEDFVANHMATKLFGVFTQMSKTTEHFALENGEQQLTKHFDNVKLHLPPESYLHVTEAEPFINYILSMARWSLLVDDVSKQEVDKVVTEARIVAEKSLPIRITTSAGLFEAW